MIKKTLLAICAVAAMSSCGGNKNAQEINGYMIDGTIANIKEGTVYLKQYDDRAFSLVDSAEVSNGKFKFMGVATQTLAYGVTTEKSSKKPLVFFLENKAMTMNIDEENKTIDVEGSPATVLYNENVDKVGKEGFSIDSFITNHPESAVGPYFIMHDLAWSIDLDNMKKLRNSLDTCLNGNLYVKQIDELISHKEAIQIGNIAPEISVPDADGKEISLSSFRGKYVLVDFWASWCPDCRREIPFLKDAMKKYAKKNFTIWGVSLDRSRDAWVSCIEKEDLKWQHSSDLKMWDSEIAKIYALRWIPASFLIDPEGKILSVSLNEDELVANLKEAFGE